jgi:hypothetical protein
MTTVYTRASKGSALTWTEGDANITNLNNDKLEDITNESIGDLSDVVITAAATGEILIYNGTNWVNGDAGIDLVDLSVGTEATASGDGAISYDNTTGVFTYTPPTAAGIGALTDIVNDTTPQLGGSLDVNGQSIVSVSNGNISITPNGTGQTVVKNIEYNENIFALGTTGGTIAPNVANGNVQTITLNSALTINAFTSPVAGQSLTLIINGGTAYTSITSTMKFAGGIKTLTGTAGCVDILTVFYDGTNYWASLGKDFK